MKIKMLHPCSVVSHINIDPQSPLAKDDFLIKVLQECHVVYGRDEELVLAQHYPWPRGLGRSIRAIVLGLEYKSAYRTQGSANEFYYNQFNFPPENAGYLRAVEAAKNRK